MDEEPTDPITSTTAPDLSAVRDFIDRMLRASRFRELIAAIVALVTRFRNLNALLVRQLTEMRRARPRSERLRVLVGQMPFAFVVSPEELAAQCAGAKPSRTRRPGKQASPHGRPKLPAHLPRVDVFNLVPESERMCATCGRLMERVGCTTCEMLEVEPARVYVIVRHDETVACPADDTIVSAPKPGQIIERGMLGPTLLVKATIDKFVDHMPIERQCRAYEREGVSIAPNTLGAGVGAVIDLLEPIARRIQRRVLACTVVSTDTTGLPVLDSAVTGSTRIGTMWSWVGDEKWVAFDYATTGEALHAEDFLGDADRIVQSDGTSLMNFVERAGGCRPGCWSHGRRRVVEALRLGDPRARLPVEIIAELFAVEARLREEHSDIIDRLRIRRLSALPVLDRLRDWIDEHAGGIEPKSPLGKAVGYMQRQWMRLCLFTEHGGIPITNNHVERQLRRLVCGRKNWMFVGGDRGGERAAIIYTIVATCALHGVNPMAFIREVVDLIINGWPQKRVDELLPDHWARGRSSPSLGAGDARAA